MSLPPPKSLLARAKNLCRPLRLFGLVGLLLPIALPVTADATGLPRAWNRR